MFALISTFETEQPFRFCQVAVEKFPVTEGALFWVDCPESVTPQTHKYTTSGFQLIPEQVEQEQPV